MFCLLCKRIIWDYKILKFQINWKYLKMLNNMGKILLKSSLIRSRLNNNYKIFYLLIFLILI